MKNFKVRDIIKLGGSALMSFMTYDSWRLSVQSSKNEQLVKEANDQLSAVKAELSKLYDKDIYNSDKLVALKGRALQLNKEFEDVLTHQENIKNCKEALKSASSESDKVDILHKIDYYRSMEESSLRKSLDTATDLKNKIFSEVHSDTVISSQSTTVIDNAPVSESNILGPFTDFIEEYQNFLSTLNSEELACLFNSLGFLMIYFAFTSIVTVLFGEFIIQKLQLETRFPRLAKYLKLRQKVNKYYIILNIIIVYLIIIIFIYININRIFS